MDQISLEIIKIYNALLYICGVNNIILAIVLIAYALKSGFARERDYRVSCVLSAMSFVVFGCGYLLHAIYQPRLISPMLATALNISFYHIGGVLFAYSYTSLMLPHYITRRSIVINSALTLLGLFGYWYPFHETFYPAAEWQWAYVVILIHLGLLATLFYKAFFLKRKGDMENTAEPLGLFNNTLSQSSHLIVCVGLGCVALFYLYPDTIVLYAALMLLAYFLFYFIYRALYLYGKHLIGQEAQDNSHARHKRLFRYSSIYHLIVLVVATTVLSWYHDISDTRINMGGEPVLNITKNTMWDTPEMQDWELDKFVDLISHTADSVNVRRCQLSSEDTTGYETTLAILKEMYAIPESPYKGYFLMECLNNAMVTVPDDSFTPTVVHEYIEEGYRIAQGPDAVPQSLFFTFWNNAMISYSNLSAPDSIYKEAMRFMKICRMQGHPLGVMEAHAALAYCFQEVRDSYGAAEHFREATKLAEKHFPALLGKNWKKKDVNISNFLSEYQQIKSMESKCRCEIGDTLWIKDNCGEIMEVIRDCEDIYVTANYYYALANYYNLADNEEMFGKIMTDFQRKLGEAGCFESRERSTPNLALLNLYNITLVKHELKLCHADKAMKIVMDYPEIFNDSSLSYKPEVLLLNGKFEEAAKAYKATCDYLQKLSNSSNRNLTKSLSLVVEEEGNQMQLLQAKLENQQTRMMYNSLFVFLLIVMITGLVFFLLRQRRLNRELACAADAAERANHAKDIFLKNMTHELHTPMNAIYGFAQLLADQTVELDKESTQDMAGHIVEGAEQLTKVLDNIVEVTDKLSALDRLEDVESVLKGEG